MPLITCPVCSKEVSSAAPNCPGCGHPLAASPLPAEPAPVSPVSSQTHIVVHQAPREFKGLVKTSWILIVVACLLAVIPFFGFASWFIAGPIFLATFIMSIMAMSRGGTTQGILLLLTSMFIAPLFVICAPFISSLLGIAGAGAAVVSADQDSRPTSHPQTIIPAPSFSKPSPTESQSDFTEDFDSSSRGASDGIRYVSTPTGTGAAFGRSYESRMEYSFAQGFPTEGTLEWRILINHGYSYAEGVLTDFKPDALLFTTVGPDTWYPGCAWLTVSRDGTINFGMADSIGGQTPVRNLVAKSTSFRFGEWHTVGISYGSQGRSITVDGQIVAQDSFIQPLGAGGTPDRPADEPTIGEMASRFWPNNKHDGGFDGVVDSFRVSSKQADWKFTK